MTNENKKELKEKICRFLERCKKLPSYRVKMFVENKNKLDILECEVLDEIIRENGDAVSVQRFGDNIFITTEVDGEFQISAVNENCARRGHVIMVDSSIRQSVVDTVIKPQIMAYETQAGGAMLNPKLIYFKL